MPAHQNFANGLSFFAQFSYNNDVLKYYLQNVKLPDIQSGVIPVNKNGVVIHVAGSSFDAGNIPMTFIVDEMFEVYTTLVDLQKQYMSTSETIDILEIFIQNNQNINIIKFVFEGIQFSSVGGPDMQTTESSTEIFCDVTMEFQNWYFQRMI